MKYKRDNKKEYFSNFVCVRNIQGRKKRHTIKMSKSSKTMSKRHADSAPEKAPKRRKLSAGEVLVEAAGNGDTTAVRAGLEKLSPDADSKTVVFDAVHETCRGNHDECLALLLPNVETTQMGFGVLLSECIHADHTACTEVLLQHWKSVCSNVAFVPHGQEDINDRACPAMWADSALCQVLISAGTDIETKDDIGRFPLHLACRTGALAVVKMLVEEGAALRATDHEGDTCLVLAAAFGHTETVRYLVGLKDVDVHHKDSDGYTALLLAADENHSDVVEVLIDAGADIEVESEQGQSSLHVACRSGALAVVKVLVKAGAGVCVTTDEGIGCLMFAADYGHTETVRYLLCIPEVDVNQTNIGFTPLHRAVMQKHSDVVSLLIAAGADIEAQSRGMGAAPLHHACEVGGRDIIKMLLKAGADVRTTNQYGDSCLTVAAKHGHTEAVRYLVALEDVDVNHINLSGRTALYYAQLKKHAGIVQVLLEHGGR